MVSLRPRYLRLRCQQGWLVTLILAALLAGCSVNVYDQLAGGFASEYLLWMICFVAGLMAREFLDILRSSKLGCQCFCFLGTG